MLEVVRRIDFGMTLHKQAHDFVVPGTCRHEQGRFAHSVAGVNRRAGPEIELSPDIRSAASEPDWEIERLNKKIMLEQAARIRLLAELLEVFKTNKPAEAVRLARKMIEEEMR